MKNKILTLTFCFIFAIGFGQTLKWDETEKYNYKYLSYLDFSEYHAKDGSVYKVGDKITFGKATNGPTYNYIFVYVALTAPSQISSGFNGESFKITRITLNGQKKQGNSWVTIWTETNIGAGEYMIKIDQAIESGEIVSPMALEMQKSDNALKELETWKKKLDLGLITEEEYNAKKEELRKFIK